MPYKKIKVALIGYGRMGRVHFQNMMNMNQVEVTAICDLNTAQFRGESCPGEISRFSDPQGIFEMKGIDAVIICTPTPTHLPLIEKACKAGLHIFCEKPLETDVCKIREIEELVRASGVKLQVGFNRRFDDNFRQLRKSVEDGRVGIPHILKITSRDPYPPELSYIRESGGLFMDMTIHDFDIARFLLQDEITGVYATGAVLTDPLIGEAGDIDTALITLKFRNGAMAHIDNSRKATYGYDQRAEVFGSEGMVQIQNKPLDTQIYFDQKGSHHSPLYGFFMDRYKTSYKAEIEKFAEAILLDEEVPVNCHDALWAAASAAAAIDSLKTGSMLSLDHYTCS